MTSIKCSSDLYQLCATANVHTSWQNNIAAADLYVLLPASQYMVQIPDTYTQFTARMS
jgi:hypothetical protein